MSVVKKVSDIDFKKVNYSKPEKNGQSYSSSISYDSTTQPLYIQTPRVKCLTSVKGLQGKKDPYLEVEVPDGKYSLYDFFLSLDDENIKQTVNNSREWFNKDIPYEAIDGMYKRVTKAFRNDSNPKLKFKIFKIKNKIACGAYNQRKVFIDINEIGVDSELILVVHIRGLKILKQKRKD